MKTQRVKILVLVCKDGSYSAGGNGEKGKLEKGHVVDWLPDCLPNHIRDGDWHRVWVEADVPLPPDPPVTKGESKADRDAMEATLKFIRDECDWEGDKRIGPAITKVLKGETKS